MKQQNKELIRLQVIEYLKKMGNNPNDVIKMVKEHFDYAFRVYEDASVRTLAEVIRTIY